LCIGHCGPPSLALPRVRGVRFARQSATESDNCDLSLNQDVCPVIAPANPLTLVSVLCFCAIATRRLAPVVPMTMCLSRRRSPRPPDGARFACVRMIVPPLPGTQLPFSCVLPLGGNWGSRLNPVTVKWWRWLCFCGLSCLFVAWVSRRVCRVIVWGELRHVVCCPRA